MTGVIVNRDQLASALKVSTVTITSWLDDDFEGGLPCLERGGNGRAYQFDLDACIAWWRRRDQDHRRIAEETQRAINERQATLDLIGGEGDSETEGLTAKGRAEYYHAEHLRMKTARERGELCEAAEVNREFNELFQNVARFLQALPDRVERETGLEPGAVEAMRQAIDGYQSGLARELMTAGRIDAGDE